MWYEHVTGDSLDGLSLAEQRERVDVIARRFRVYNDGRAPRPTGRICLQMIREIADRGGYWI